MLCFLTKPHIIESNSATMSTTGEKHRRKSANSQAHGLIARKAIIIEIEAARRWPLALFNLHHVVSIAKALNIIRNKILKKDLLSGVHYHWVLGQAI